MMKSTKCDFCGRDDEKGNFVKDLNMYLCKRHSGQYYQMGKLYKRTQFDPNEIVIKDNYAEIVLYNKYHEEIARSKIDLEDVDLVKSYKWGLTPQHYCRNNTGGMFLHNLLLGEYNKNELVVDHINRNRLDNRRSNLRLVNYTLNGFNKSKQSNNTSGHVGVSWDKEKNKWEAHIKRNKRKIFLGYFEDLQDAIARRKQAELDYYGTLRNKEYDKNVIYKKCPECGAELRAESGCYTCICGFSMCG